MSQGKETIIARWETRSDEMTLPGALVVVWRDDPHTPYVVWWQGVDGSRCHGDYCEKRSDALCRFLERCQCDLRYWIGAEQFEERMTYAKGQVSIKPPKPAKRS